MPEELFDPPSRAATRSALERPPVERLHHVRLPVTDVMVSRDWYAEVFGFEPILDIEEEDRVTGVALEHPSGLMLGVHLAPERARALQGFTVFGLAVADLGAWLTYLDASGIEHGGIVDGHLGECIALRDPDGIVVELHTPIQPSVQDA